MCLISFDVVRLLLCVVVTCRLLCAVVCCCWLSDVIAFFLFFFFLVCVCVVDVRCRGWLTIAFWLFVVRCVLLFCRWLLFIVVCC